MDNITLAEIGQIVDAQKGSGYFASLIEKPFTDFIRNLTEIPESKIKTPTDALFYDKNGNELEFVTKARKGIAGSLKGLSRVLNNQIQGVKKMSSEKFVQAIFGNRANNMSVTPPSSPSTEIDRGPVMVQIANTDAVASSIAENLQTPTPNTTTRYQRSSNDDDDGGKKKKKTILGQILKWGSIAGIVGFIGNLLYKNPKITEKLLEWLKFGLDAIKGMLDWFWGKLMEPKTHSMLSEFIVNGFKGALTLVKGVLGAMLESAFGDVAGKFKVSFSAGLMESLKGGVAFIASWFAVEHIPVIGKLFKGIRSLLLKPFKLPGLIKGVAVTLKGAYSGMVKAGKMFLMYAGKSALKLAWGIGAIAAAVIELNEAWKAGKAAWKEWKGAKEAEDRMLKFANKSVEKTQDKITATEERLAELRAMNPKNAEERLAIEREITLQENKRLLMQTQAQATAAIALMSYDEKRGKELAEAARTERQRLMEERITTKISILGDTALTREMSKLLKEGGAFGQRSGEYSELKRKLDESVSDDGKLLLKTVSEKMDESVKATKDLQKVVAEGAMAQLGMAETTSSATIQAINNSSQKDINVTSKIEYERAWGFRENARNFIYPERVGMVYAV